MPQSPLSTKVGVKPGNKMLLLNAPSGYLQAFEPLPEKAGVTADAAGSFDVVQVFVQSKADVDRFFPQAVKALRPGGLLWIAYPKKSSRVKTDVSRDEGWESIHAAGWQGVSLVSMDDTWSDMRFRPEAEIKAKR